MESATTELVSPKPARRPWFAIAMIAAVFAAHIVQSFWIFPTPRALRDDEHPVLVVDHALHLYHGALGSQFLREHGTSWGFDPFFMAGYPESPIWDSSSNLSILFQFLAGGGYHPRAYNIGLLVCSILVVAFIPLGAAASGIRLPETAVAALLAWLYVHSEWTDMLWRSGLFSFVTASAGTVLLIGALLRFDRRPTTVAWLALAGVSAAVWFTHVTAPILALGAVIGFGAATALRHHWRWRLAVVAAGVLALVVNLIWIGPFWRFRGIRSPQVFFMAPDTPWYLIGQYLTNDLDGPLSLFILLVGGLGLVVWFVQGHHVRAATFGGAALVCLGLALFGGMWSVTKTLEPLRFKVPLHLLLAAPAGSLLAVGSARLTGALGGGRKGPVLVAVGWSLAVGLAILVSPNGTAILKQQLLVKRPLVAGLRPEMLQLVRSLRETTDPSARVLFEDQLRLHELTDPECTHWTPLLPILLGRDKRLFIGGLYHMAFITNHQHTSFGDFHLGGRPIDTCSTEYLRAYCQLYNIGWAVCWSPLSRCCFDQWGQSQRVATLPRFNSPNKPISTNMQQWQALTRRVGIERAKQYMTEGEGQYNIYRIDRPRSFFLSGEGHLADVALNRIELADTTPQDGALIISMHWLDTWRTDPPLPLEPFYAPDDPVPFVRIVTTQSHKRIVLYNGYGP
ncbi:hypothetical protein SAMN05444166_1903 [Singulisphaera sp. GP187]|uniref:hypothetical protein n=1 Tax=Singulisphaera sp. GP187 TaxID=1882752 RepID=UPI0009295107|nr:hypothetical protein [Singulisphaera sp. GP187]SIN98323.1 hypothetical protein SAMN05444166_1903 [Singulisphaera sp. GP187]